MRKISIVLLGICVLAAFVFNLRAFADREGARHDNAAALASPYIPNELIVKYYDASRVPGRETELRQEIDGLEKLGYIEVLGAYVISCGDMSVDPGAALDTFKNNPLVEYAEPNYEASFSYEPSDPHYARYQENSMTLINAAGAWDLKTGGGPPVAIVDSGVVESHPDLPKPLGGYAAVPGLSPFDDAAGHGTNVAGVIAAIGDNGIGGAGINWDAAIMPVKADDENGVLAVSNIAKSIVWAADNGAKIINLGLGLGADSITLKGAVDYAYNKGCAIIAAVGNDGENTVDYPARYWNVLGVGATSDGLTRETTSNYGEGLDVVALHASFTTANDGEYAAVGGTSFAAAQATAAASLAWSLDPTLSVDELYELIKFCALPLGNVYDEQMGYGLIDIGLTMRCAKGCAGGVPEQAAVGWEPPRLTLMGFPTVDVEVGGVYDETGFWAVDCEGADITSRVTVSGGADLSREGEYVIGYAVTDGSGASASATRTVRVVPAGSVAGADSDDPADEEYGFAGEGDVGSAETYEDVVVDTSGDMEIIIDGLTQDAMIEVVFADAATGKTAHRDCFAANGAKRFGIEAGEYVVNVGITRAPADGGVRYTIGLKTPYIPAVITFRDDEVAKGSASETTADPVAAADGGDQAPDEPADGGAADITDGEVPQGYVEDMSDIATWLAWGVSSAALAVVALAAIWYFRKRKTSDN